MGALLYGEPHVQDIFQGMTEALQYFFQFHDYAIPDPRDHPTDEKQLNQLALTKNILSALSASRDTPPITAYPKSHRTTFHYYHGVILFLSEDYAAAETALTSALSLCPLPRSRTATTSPAASMAITKNRTLILTYLIPCRLLTSHKLPSGKLLAVYPELARLFGPLCKCIRNGDLKGFDDALAAGEAEFVKRRVYLTLERGRDIALRNVLRKVVGAEMDENGTRRARVRIEEFVAGLRIANGRAGGDAVMRGLEDGGEDAEDERDEVECFIANAIYKVRAWVSRFLSESDECIDTTAESHERLHSARPGHGRPIEERRLPRDGRVKPWRFMSYKASIHSASLGSKRHHLQRLEIMSRILIND